MYAASGDEASTGRFNVPAPTLGGKQVWSDVWLLHDLRIQRHAITGHHRLLDENDIRHAWGTLDECRAKLNRIAKDRGLGPMSGRAVVVVHGLGRTRSAMKKIAEFLRKKGGYHVFNVGYATTRGNVADHAQTLASVLESLASMEQINFVAHSLGNLVIRRWLHDVKTDDAVSFDRKRLGRMVMLAPPNQRPVLANRVGRLKGAKTIGGESFVELAERWNELAPTLAIPEFDFGIVAGGKGNRRGYNLLIPGDDDMVVSVEGTKLTGARDFRVVPVLHTFIMNDPAVHEFALRFLKHGYFESEAKRRQIV